MPHLSKRGGKKHKTKKHKHRKLDEASTNPTQIVKADLAKNMCEKEHATKIQKLQTQHTT
jgi:hypothetical protein